MPTPRTKGVGTLLRARERNAPTRKDFEHVVERIGSDLVRQEAAKGRWGKGKIYV